jgi:hypothetical protein
MELERIADKQLSRSQRTLVACSADLLLKPDRHLICSMETADEELKRLRAENSSLLQLRDKDAEIIACKDELLATKDEFLASRAVELQRCHELLQQRSAIAGSDAADSRKRQRLHDSSVLPLDRDEVLDRVFRFVGGGDHLYVSGVSRRWRGRYLGHCAQNSTSDIEGKCVTRRRSVLMTESRLQVALNSGLTLTGWSFSSGSRADLICKHSLEPERVLVLLRMLGVLWSSDLCRCAAYCNKLALLQWLYSRSCLWQQGPVLLDASAGGSVAMLEWLLTVTPPWSSDSKQRMLHVAGCRNTFAVVQWLRDHGADWPQSFCACIKHFDSLKSTCWPLSTVQWALACGSGWRAWHCEHYAAEQYQDMKTKQRATELLDWAHANGCPCTCGHVQQQQQ